MVNFSGLSANSVVEIVGEFPEIVGSNYYFPKGFIQLRLGKHTAPNRGFGIKHKEAEHLKEIRELGFISVIDYVKAIIVENAKIFYEFSDLRGHHRPLILKSSIGIVVLESKNTSEGIVYSVVTAYRRNNAHGVQIGIIR